MADKVILAYSGGLDTSVAVTWIKEKYGLDVITLTIDVGNEKDFTVVKEKALKVGAIKALVADVKQSFVDYFIFPALQANALYEGQYPLATALSRPLMAKLLVDTAREEGAVAVAHGCTGKGNDQVRFDVGINTLAPNLKIIAPAREWGMTREETIAYAKKHDIPVPITVSSPYSIDECLWGKAIECGVLEDPWIEPPEDAFTWTKAADKTPDKPTYMEIGFEKGIPVSLDGELMNGVELIQQLNEVAGNHGIGRIDHIENRVVGIKSREIYEAPAATVLIEAHKALEAMTLSKDQLRFKDKVSTEYADLIYNGLWFSGLNRDLSAYIISSQRDVTGTVKMKLFKTSARVVGRKSPRSLYNLGLATYDKGDKFDQSAAIGFIHLWGLPVKTQAQAQILADVEGPLSIMAPKETGKVKVVRHRSFNEVWQDIKRLEGKDVFTLCRQNKNTIKKVDDKEMIRYAHMGRGSSKPVPMTAFKKVWTILIKQGYFVRKETGGWGIACACIGYLPEVEYSCKNGSLRLYLMQQNTHPFGEVKEYTE